jgi:hypothetical protein
MLQLALCLFGLRNSKTRQNSWEHLQNSISVKACHDAAHMLKQTQGMQSTAMSFFEQAILIIFF